ncbi:MAG: hypothetical protein NF693_09330 [Bombella sp.]|nr:hypothetical protein [Bombella sp.]
MSYSVPRSISDLEKLDVDLSEVSCVFIVEDEFGQTKELFGAEHDYLFKRFKKFKRDWTWNTVGEYIGVSYLVMKSVFSFVLSKEAPFMTPFVDCHATADENFILNDDGLLESIGFTVCVYIKRFVSNDCFEQVEQVRPLRG